MIVLDISSVIDLLDGTAKGEKIKDFLLNEVAAVSSITVNELLVGKLKRNLQITRNFLSSCNIISFDKRIALKSAEIENDLWSKGKMIGKLDIFIASTALVHELPLLTCDNDFKKISGLKIIFV